MMQTNRRRNLSKYDAPLSIQFKRGLNAYKGKQFIKTVRGHKIIATENPYPQNTMQHREWQHGDNFGYANSLGKEIQWKHFYKKR